MLLPATNLRKGMIIRYDKVPHLVTQASHVVTGRGGANIQSKLKNLVTGRNAEYRWSSDEKFEEIELDQFPMEYLYQDGDGFHFMNSESYEQVALPPDIIGDQAVYLQEGMKVNLAIHEGVAVSITMPQKVTLEIKETEPAMKGQTASGSFKPAILSNGVRIMKISNPAWFSEEKTSLVPSCDTES